MQEFAKFFPDIAFLSINAVNYKDGFTDFRLNEIPIIQCLASVSRQVVAVMDSSKLGKCSKVRVLAPNQVDLLLTDEETGEDIREKYAQKGITIR